MNESKQRAINVRIAKVKEEIEKNQDYARTKRIQADELDREIATLQSELEELQAEE